MAELKKLSKIDERTKDAVIGWIRETEKELSMNHTPLMISSLCILFFFAEEIFEFYGDNVEASNNHKTITKTSNEKWSLFVFIEVLWCCKSYSSSWNLFK